MKKSKICSLIQYPRPLPSIPTLSGGVLTKAYLQLTIGPTTSITSMWLVDVRLDATRVQTDPACWVCLCRHVLALCAVLRWSRWQWQMMRNVWR